MSRKPREKHSGPAIDVLTEDARWKAEGANLVAEIKRAATMTLSHARQSPTNAASLTVLLAGDEQLRELNHRYRNRDKATNVLSFPSDAGSGYLGDIAIAYEVSAKEARDGGKPFTAHVMHLTVHGVLHLLGYNHEKPRQAEKMESLEATILAEFGIPNPYRERAAQDA